MRVLRRSAWVLAVVLTAVCMLEAAAAEGAPAFNTRRFLEDWSGYSADGSDCWGSQVKKIDLTDDIWLSIGGQSRLRIEAWSAFGFNDANDDEFVLFRQFLHTDLAHVQQVQVFEDVWHRPRTIRQKGNQVLFSLTLQ